MTPFEFQPFEKIARLRKEQVVTEKLDGTNAHVAIFAIESEEQLAAARSDPYRIAVRFPTENGDSPLVMYAGSRQRWIAPEGTPDLPKGCDNFGFARWVQNNADALWALGEGRHYGEWYGAGIQRNYGLTEKRFALFNVARWTAENPQPACCSVVPTLASDPEIAMEQLARNGSFAVPGFMNPEGIIVFHTGSRTLYKQTFDHDTGKWAAAS